MKMTCFNRDRNWNKELTGNGRQKETMIRKSVCGSRRVNICSLGNSAPIRHSRHDRPGTYDHVFCHLTHVVDRVLDLFAEVPRPGEAQKPDFSNRRADHLCTEREILMIPTLYKKERDWMQFAIANFHC